MGLEAAQREQKGELRRGVHPVEIIDHDHHGARCQTPTEQIEESGSHDLWFERPLHARAERRELLGDRSPRGEGKLLDDAVGQRRLGLVAARAEEVRHGAVGDERCDEPLQQGRLADAGGPLDEHEPGFTRHRLAECPGQEGDFLVPSKKVFHSPGSGVGVGNGPAQGRRSIRGHRVRWGVQGGVAAAERSEASSCESPRLVGRPAGAGHEWEVWRGSGEHYRK